MITIVAHCTIKKGSTEAFLQTTKPLIEGTRKEPGNISYDLYLDLSSPEKYTFIEVWKDQNAIDEHNASAHFNGFVAAAGPLFDGDLDIRLYQKVSA
jgi:quinol monooxygenase YgiN